MPTLFAQLIPPRFIRTHGHMLDAILSLTGPNGQASTVAIRTYPPIRGRGQTEMRHFLGPGWKEFVKEHGFQVGDCVLFRLVGNSCFQTGLVSSKLQGNAVAKTTRTGQLSKCEKESGRFPQFTRKLSRVSLFSPDMRLVRILPKSNPAPVCIEAM